MVLDALGYYRNMRDTKTILIYSGPVWIVSVEELGETILKRLELEELPVSASYSIFSVFVEQMNNISLYSAEKDTFEKNDDKHSEVARGVFILGTVGDRYFLQCGNMIDEYSYKLIKRRIDHLNSLDKQELRKYYREQLNGDNSNPESKGAGLGLTEIAKLASSKIEYDFIPMDNGLSFFTMFVEMVGKRGAPSQNEGFPDFR